MQSTTHTKKEITTTTEFKISGRSSTDSGRIGMTSIHRVPDYKSATIYGSSTTGGLYGPGARPGKLTSERRSLSGSSLSAAVTIRDEREREKKEISDLNDRFALYIEKVRFLDAQNRKMLADLELFRARMGKDTMSTKAMYEGEIAEARKVVAQTNVEREDLEKQIRRLLAEIGDYRKKYDDAANGRELDRRRVDELIVRFTEIEREANLLRRRIAEADDEVGSLKKINIAYLNLQSRLRTDIDQESLARIDYQNQVQMLLEEIEFTRREHEQELNDLHAMAARDTTKENREFFKSELAAAIKAIRAEYDEVMAVNRNDVESWYKLKVQEVHTTSNRQTLERGYAKEEVRRLRINVTDLRTRLADFEARNSLLEKQLIDLNFQLEDEQRTYEATLKERDVSIRIIREECEALVIELQRLLDTKASLEAEIIEYRRLLEGEETRAGMRKLIIQKEIIEMSEMEKKIAAEKLTKDSGETTNKITFQGSAKGNISVRDAAVDGKFIILENTHAIKAEDIGGWKVKRSVDNGDDVVFTFPANFVLKPLKTVKIWAKSGEAVYNPPDHLVFEGADSFGMGINARTVVENLEGEERATHLQTTSHKTVIYA